MALAGPRDPDAIRALLDARYGPAPGSRTRRRRRAVIAGGAALLLTGFIAFALHATQEPVRTRDIGFRVIDDATVEVSFQVFMDPGTTADCTVLALNRSFAEVGVGTVVAGPATDTAASVVTTWVRTTEPATGARISGCTPRPEG